MTPELDAHLVAKFPALYRDRHASMQDTCMCWGFAVNDGWYPIIYMLSAALSSLDDIPVAAQVKEKFGGLRYYFDGGDYKACNALVDVAERASYVTCEECGKPGRARKGGWIKTLCDECDGKDG